jgi:hypothetical protein
MLNHFEIVFWIDSLHVFEDDENMKSCMDSLVKIFINLATKTMAKIPLRLLVTCRCQSGIVDRILDGSKSIPVLEVPSAAEFKSQVSKDA